MSLLPTFCCSLQACSHDLELQNILRQHHLTPERLWRMCQAADHRLKRKLESLKRELTQEDKDRRLEAAEELRKLSLAKLKATVFVDEASVHLNVSALKVVSLRGDDCTREDRRLRSGSKLRGSLHYILGVNAHIGLVFFRLTSASAGSRLKGAFRVRRAGRSGRSRHTMGCTDCRPGWGRSGPARWPL